MNQKREQLERAARFEEEAALSLQVCIVSCIVLYQSDFAKYFPNFADISTKFLKILANLAKSIIGQVGEQNAQELRSLDERARQMTVELSAKAERPSEMHSIAQLCSQPRSQLHS